MPSEIPDQPSTPPSTLPSYHKGYHLDLYLRFRHELLLEVARQWMQDFATLEPSWYGDLAKVRGVRLVGAILPDVADPLESLKKILSQLKNCELGLRPYLKSSTSTEYLPWTRNRVFSKSKLEGFETLALEPGVRYIFED